LIEVGQKQVTGLILEVTEKPSYKTKNIIASINQQPMPTQLINLAFWLSNYYSTHLASVIQIMLPRGLQRQRKNQEQKSISKIRKRTKIVFSKEQLSAINIIMAMGSGSVLLHGVTGSGKTNIYIEVTKQILAEGKSVILLVPEIALTSQLFDEFSASFKNIILTHSRQTEAERHQAWQKALENTTPCVIIGPRSALFLPISNIGLVVIDEAHEPSFKQEKAPRYSALRAASVLANLHQAKLILGSATPSIMDYYLAQHSGSLIIKLLKPVKKNTVKPTISLIDMTQRQYFMKHRFLSDKLISSLSETFEHKRQALIFHNRRGTATTTLCKSCGWIATCPETFIPLILHADQHVLCSHLTGKTWPVPTNCPICSETDIIHKGIGTQLIENELHKLFPTINIGRFDSDNKAAETLHRRYHELYSGQIDLIIGTQIVAKGLDLPKLRTVGIVQADTGLNLPDYSAGERTFQLLAQVVGRVGRNHHPTKVIVQSYQPTNPIIADGLSQNYDHFYETNLAERRKANFPPYSFIVKLICIYKTERAAIKNSQQLAYDLRSKLSKDVQILGPAPAFYERQHGTYRWQLILKSSKRQLLLDALKYLPPQNWQFEIDPISLL
jgi:primosomal protein N' (replication factor Y)